MFHLQNETSFFLTMQVRSDTYKSTVSIAEKQLLKQHQLKVTIFRLRLIAIFLKQNVAISEREIKKQLGTSYDRITLYRTLETFLKKKLIHKITIDKGETLYALSYSNLNYETSGIHAHFKCTACETCWCVPLDKEMFKYNYIENTFKIEEIEIIIKGKCKKCQTIN